MPLLIDHLAGTGRLRPELPRDEAADTVWAVNSTEVYAMLTQVRGWTDGRYERWLASTLRRLLLTGTPVSDPPDPPDGPAR
jgi:hypothetical protein